MKISVVMPAYNTARTIRAAIDSVLCQTLPAHEILVLDDGSTDDTAAIVRSYGPAVTLVQHENGGSATARNYLCSIARGELIAFLDSDDIWHPRYLEVQAGSFATRQDLAASFTSLQNFYGYGDFEWAGAIDEPGIEVFDPVSFLVRYNEMSGMFGSASVACVPKRVLRLIGDEPFKLPPTDDSYLYTWLPLLGPVGYSRAPLVAYRITQSGQSTDKLVTYEAWVRVFEALAPHYQQHASPELLNAFQSAFMSKRRQCAKRLVAAGRATEARGQLRMAIAQSRRPACIAKSLGLLAATHMPGQFQPTWPDVQREWREPEPAGQSK